MRTSTLAAHAGIVAWGAPFFALLLLTFTRPVHSDPLSASEAVLMPLLVAALYTPFGMIFSIPAAVISGGVFYLLRRVSAQSPAWWESFLVVAFPAVGVGLGALVSEAFDQLFRATDPESLLTICLITGGIIGAVDYFPWRKPFEQRTTPVAQ